MFQILFDALGYIAGDTFVSLKSQDPAAVRIYAHYGKSSMLSLLWQYQKSAGTPD